MDQIKSLTKRPKLYCNIDGVAELAMGFMLLGGAALQWLAAHPAPGAAWHRLFSLFLVLSLMVAAVHYGTKAIKERFTYPRTGYVEYRRRDTFWVPMIYGAATGALTSAGMVLAIHRHWATGPALLIGLLVVATYGYYFARTDPWKWIIAAALALVTLAIAVLPAHLLATVAGNTTARHLVRDHRIGSLLLSFLCYGVIFFISGGVSLWLYLRRTQPPAAEAQ